MITDYKPYDEILNEIHDNEWLAITRDSSISSTALNRLVAERLIYIKNQRSVYYLTKDGYKAVSLGGFEKWLQYTETKQNTASKNFNVFGNLSISDSKVNLFSDNSTISSPEEVLFQLENMINLLSENQKLDIHFKAKLIDMNTELQSLIHTSKENKLPILDNIVSLAANFTSLFGSF